MSYTGTEVFNQAIALIDELSDTGTVVDAQISEYKYRAPSLLDAWQRERPEIYKTFTVSRHPITNLLGDQYNTQEHVNEDISYETQTAAQSAVFYVTDQANVYIEENSSGTWANVSGYYAADDGSEVSFTGLITVAALTAPAKYKCRFTTTGPTRIRFSGSYYYNFYNFALFMGAFPTCAKVPEYGEYVKYTTPTDFDSVLEITEESPEAGFTHKWENQKDLYINIDFDGVLKVTYRAAPAKITTLTQTLEVSDAYAVTGIYYLAMHFALSDMNTELMALCKTKYDELMEKVKRPRPLAATYIQDVYDISGIR